MGEERRDGFDDKIRSRTSEDDARSPTASSMDASVRSGRWLEGFKGQSDLVVDIPVTKDSVGHI
jgi:hypothetical protein